jgi:hypothetical protein
MHFPLNNFNDLLDKTPQSAISVLLNIHQRGKRRIGDFHPAKINIDPNATTSLAQTAACMDTVDSVG